MSFDTIDNDKPGAWYALTRASLLTGEPVTAGHPAFHYDVATGTSVGTGDMDNIARFKEPEPPRYDPPAHNDSGGTQKIFGPMTVLLDRLAEHLAERGYEVLLDEYAPSRRMQGFDGAWRAVVSVRWVFFLTVDGVEIRADHIWRGQWQFWCYVSDNPQQIIAPAIGENADPRPIVDKVVAWLEKQKRA